MVVTNEEVLKFVSEIAIEARVTISESSRCADVTGDLATLGGFIGGSIGLVIGALIGSVACVATAENFKPIYKALLEMEEEKKDHLAEGVRKIMENIGVYDITAFAGKLAADTFLKRNVINEIVDLILNEIKEKKVNILPTKEEILEFVLEIAMESRETIWESLRCANLTRHAAFFGGVSGGRFGLVAGSFIGSIVCVATGQSFKPIYKAVLEMEEERKERLADRVRKIMESIGVYDIANFTVKVATNIVLKRSIAKEFVDFIENELNM